MTEMNVIGRGARGESFADVARRVGSFAGVTVPSDATDAEVLSILTDAYSEIAAAAGYLPIDPVRAATTANITLSGAQTIDGVSVIATDRVLVKNQTLAAQNGVYIAAAGAWSRATDFDQTAEVIQGSYVLVLEGATQTQSAWVLTTADPITVGTTEQSWKLFRDMSGYVTKSGVETLSNKTIADGMYFITDGERIGFTDGSSTFTREGVVHILNAGATGEHGSSGVGLLVTSKWTGSTGTPYTNNDNVLFTCYNKTLSNSANRSWGASINNAYNDIPAGVTDSGERVGVIGWATSVSQPGYVHAGTLESQRGGLFTAGFQDPTTPATAVVNAAAGVAGLIYAEAPGATIANAFGGIFASDGLVGGSTIQNNYGLYARAQRGTTSNHSFYGELGTLYNFGNIVCDSQIQADTTFTESSSSITARKAGNGLEFGYPAASYGSSLGGTQSTGYPFMALCAEADPTGDTFRTRGKLGTVIWNDLAGAMIFSRLTTATATGQSLTESARFDPSGHFLPGGDNTKNLGSGSARWGTVYAGTGAINTSDERAKKNIGKIPDAWLDAWGDVEWSRFKFKGGSRWHIGLIAQRVHEAFAKHGLDAFEIGLCCYDEWNEETQPITETKMRERKVMKPQLAVNDPANVAKGDPSTSINMVETTEEYPELIDTGEREVVRESGDLWGLRYEECFAMEAAWTRRELSKLRSKK